LLSLPSALLTPPSLQGSDKSSSKRVRVAAVNEYTEAGNLDGVVVPGINLMLYSIPDPKSRSPASSFPATPSPLQDASLERI
jgi:hypothetical protein